MRSAFVETLTQLAAEDERILLLTGDLGYRALEPFSEAYPSRFFNVGVAEQNMIGLATGLAEAGFLPFVYSIATFASLRAYEFIRNGPVLQELSVRIIGVGGGFEYGPAGTSHHGLEDVGVMRIQPGLTVIAPADHRQTASAIRGSWDLAGPVYYRLGKDGRTIVPGLSGRFTFGRPERIGDGSDLAILAMGSIASEAAAALQTLRDTGIEGSLWIVSTLNPVDTDALAEQLSGFRAVLSVESHFVNGGLGSLAAEIIAEHRLDCRLRRCGVRSIPGGLTGGTAFLRAQHGLTGEAIVQEARALVARSSP